MNINEKCDIYYYMNKDRVLEIQSVQVSPIRNMITALKDVLTDASITFTDKGMKIINFDKTHTILVNVLLHANKFEHYRCDPDKIVVCANTLHLFKLISTMIFTLATHLQGQKATGSQPPAQRTRYRNTRMQQHN